MKQVFELVQLNSRKYAIFDTVTRVFYYGKKSDLLKRLKQLNERE